MPHDQEASLGHQQNILFLAGCAFTMDGATIWFRNGVLRVFNHVHDSIGKGNIDAYEDPKHWIFTCLIFSLKRKERKKKKKKKKKKKWSMVNDGCTPNYDLLLINLNYKV